MSGGDGEAPVGLCQFPVAGKRKDVIHMPKRLQTGHEFDVVLCRVLVEFAQGFGRER